MLIYSNTSNIGVGKFLYISHFEHRCANMLQNSHISSINVRLCDTFAHLENRCAKMRVHSHISNIDVRKCYYVSQILNFDVGTCSYIHTFRKSMCEHAHTSIHFENRYANMLIHSHTSKSRKVKVGKLPTLLTW